jgi:hypothetical protein
MAINKLRQFIVVVMLAAITAACNGGPTGPGPVTPPPPPGPAFGSITFVYDRAEAGIAECRAANDPLWGEQWCHPNRTVTLRANSATWAGGPDSVFMQKAVDDKGEVIPNRFVVTLHGVPATKNGEFHEVRISDGWNCPAEQGCKVEYMVARGITANGTKLTRTAMWGTSEGARYHFEIPPTVTP